MTEDIETEVETPKPSAVETAQKAGLVFINRPTMQELRDLGVELVAKGLVPVSNGRMLMTQEVLGIVIAQLGGMVAQDGISEKKLIKLSKALKDVVASQAKLFDSQTKMNSSQQAAPSGGHRGKRRSFAARQIIDVSSTEVKVA